LRIGAALETALIAADDKWLLPVAAKLMLARHLR
jgi:hypothetical protein